MCHLSTGLQRGSTTRAIRHSSSRGGHNGSSDLFLAGCKLNVANDMQAMHQRKCGYVTDEERTQACIAQSKQISSVSLPTNQSILSKQRRQSISKYVQISCYAYHVKLHRTLHQASWVIPLLVPEVRTACAAATACCSKVMLCCSAKASAAAAATAALRSEELRQDAKICIYIHRTYIIILYMSISCMILYLYTYPWCICS